MTNSSPRTVVALPGFAGSCRSAGIGSLETMTRINTVEGYLESMSDDLRPAGEQLTMLLDTALPESGGIIWHGHPVWMTRKTPVAAFKAHTGHLTFMIWRGQDLIDRSGRLQAAGSSTMANVKVYGTEDIDADLFTNWLHQAARLETT